MATRTLDVDAEPVNAGWLRGRLRTQVEKHLPGEHDQARHGRRERNLALYERQDAEIEPLPKQMTNRAVGTRLENAGDILRELFISDNPLGPASRGYIREKIRRIQSELAYPAELLARLSDADQVLADQAAERYAALPARTKVGQAARALTVAIARQNLTDIRASLDQVERFYPVLAKHLPGTHNQADHGKWADHLDDAARPIQARWVRQWEHDHCDADHESLVVFDQTGEPIVQAEGDSTRVEVDFDDAALVRSAHRKRDSYLIAMHNHADKVLIDLDDDGREEELDGDSWGLSRPDWLIACNSEMPVHEVRLITPRYRYVLRPKPGQGWPRASLVEAWYDEFENEELTEWAENGDPTIFDQPPAARAPIIGPIQHDISERLAEEFGLEYYREEHGYAHPA